MRGDHFAIEQEGYVGVEFLLDLVEPFVGPIPRSRFVHGQQHFAGLLVDSKQIDHRRIGDAGRGEFLLMILIVLLILRHWAE